MYDLLSKLFWRSKNYKIQFFLQIWDLLALRFLVDVRQADIFQDLDPKVTVPESINQ